MNEIYQITGWQLVISIIIFGVYCTILQSLIIPYIFRKIKDYIDCTNEVIVQGYSTPKWEDLTDKEKEHFLEMIDIHLDYVSRTRKMGGYK